MKRPQVFGKYLLLERLNTGGMAEVFIAKSFGVEGFERILAIKKILPTMAEDEEFITMFIDEARISVMLNHANIVHIHELGKYDETFYIAMEYVAGKDLRALLEVYRRRGEIMPTAQAVYIAAKLCEGLDYAHSRKDMRGSPLGIIHRDVTPQNVLISFDGEVKIIDFGIAKAANRSQRTQAGILKGKFGYMSPEQVLGQPLDGRSDIFALGVILYEMLTGERLFVGESDFSTLERVRTAPVPPPRQFNESIPTGLERVLLRALEREPDVRYASGADFHDDLMRFLLAGDVVYSARHLAHCMHDAFAEDLHREAERMSRFAEIERPDQIEDSGLVGKLTPLPQKRRRTGQHPKPPVESEEELTPTHGDRPQGENTQIVLAAAIEQAGRVEATDVRAARLPAEIDLPFAELDTGVHDANKASKVVIGRKQAVDGATVIGPIPERSPDPLPPPEEVAQDKTRILQKPTREGEMSPAVAEGAPLAPTDPEASAAATASSAWSVPENSAPAKALAPSEPLSVEPPTLSVKPYEAVGGNPPALPDLQRLGPLARPSPPSAAVPMLTEVPLRRSVGVKVRNSTSLRTIAAVLMVFLLLGTVAGAVLTYRTRSASGNILVTAVPDRLVKVTVGGRAVANGEVSQMPAGEYQLVVSAPGYATHRARLQVRARMVTRVEVALSRESGEGGAGDPSSKLAPLNQGSEER